MEALKIQWSLDKHQALEAELKGFWANDEWDITECPLFKQQKRVSSNRYINFGCNSPTINAEVKYACWQKLIKQEWSINTLWIHQRKIRNIVEWLNSATNKEISLIERTLERWELSLRSYLAKHNELKKRKARILRC